MERRRHELKRDLEKTSAAKLRVLGAQAEDWQTRVLTISQGCEQIEKMKSAGDILEVLSSYNDMIHFLQHLQGMPSKAFPDTEDDLQFVGAEEVRALILSIRGQGEIISRTTDPGKCLVAGLGTPHAMDRPYELVLTTYNRSGKRKTKGGDIIKVEIWVGWVSITSTVSDRKDGTYVISFLLPTGTKADSAKISITLGETQTHVKGSPFTMRLYPEALISVIGRGGVNVDEGGRAVKFTSGYWRQCYFLSTEPIPMFQGVATYWKVRVSRVGANPFIYLGITGTRSPSENIYDDPASYGWMRGENIYSGGRNFENLGGWVNYQNGDMLVFKLDRAARTFSMRRISAGPESTTSIYTMEGPRKDGDYYFVGSVNFLYSPGATVEILSLQGEDLF